MKRLIILLAVFMMSCTQQKVTDAEVIELLDNYFINKKVSVRNLFEPKAFHLISLAITPFSIS